jgi:BirA family transcriptional regulator, biotin operon repressor / biotin---[acetyl-CoA-carboxylase] ligase
MTAPIDERWGTAALQDALQQVLNRDARQPGLRAHVQAVVHAASTNTQLLDAARLEATPSVQLLVAEAQSAGRGRLGRAWHAAPGASLTFSMALPMAAVSAQALSLRVGLCTAMTLDPCPTHSAPQLQVKWPNDVWLRDAATPWGGRKLGGILIETTAAAHGRVLVVGIGLNLTLPEHGTVDARHGVASLQELAAAHRMAGHASPSASTPASTWASTWASTLASTPPAASAAAWESATRTLHRLAPSVLHALLQGGSAWQDAWPTRDALLGRRVRASVSASPPATPLDGNARGVNDDGALLVRGDDGRMHPVSSGEVSITVVP